MELIDIKTLGERIMEYRDGKAFASMKDPMLAAEQLAERMNEIIYWIEAKKAELP